MSNTPSLLPCPFCGSAAHFESDSDGWHWVECESCGMQGNRGASLMEDCKPMLAEAWNRRTPQPVVREPQCWCLTCSPMRIDEPSSIRMALCPTCGNKRCPKANDHRNRCSNSNVPGQKGSAYEGCGITQKGGQHG